MILVTAAARLRPESRDEALAAATRMQEATWAEPGCLEYRFWVAVDDPDCVLLFERWDDRAALEAHLGRTHTREFGSAIGRFGDGPLAVTTYEVADSGPLR